MLFQDIEHNIIMSIKEESKLRSFKTLNISEKVFISTENIERQDLAKT